MFQLYSGSIESLGCLKTAVAHCRQIVKEGK